MCAYIGASIAEIVSAFPTCGGLYTASAQLCPPKRRAVVSLFFLGTTLLFLLYLILSCADFKIFGWGSCLMNCVDQVGWIVGWLNILGIVPFIALNVLEVGLLREYLALFFQNFRSSCRVIFNRVWLG